MPRLARHRQPAPTLLQSSLLRSTLLLGALLCSAWSTSALAQSACASDGQRAPLALYEQFLSADCADCWSAAPPPTPATKGAAAPAPLALDWIVPSARADEAPLSAAATRDALARLEALQLAPPAMAQDGSTGIALHTAKRLPDTRQRLRVAHGQAVNDYIGTSMAYQPAARLQGQTLRATLLLIERIPAGTDGTPIARQLVRNSLTLDWVVPAASAPTAKGATAKAQRLFESRPMRLPEGAQAARLGVVGWVEDEKGRLLALAESRCAKTPG